MSRGATTGSGVESSAGVRARAALAGTVLAAAWLGAACETARPPSGDAGGAEHAAALPGHALPGVVEPPPNTALRAVALPRFDALDAQVRRQLSERVAGVREAAGRARAGSELAAAYGSLGMLLLAATQFEAAEAALANAEALAPSDARWPYYLGHLYRAKGPLEQSVAAFQRVLTSRADDVPSLVWLGEVFLAQGNAEAAADQFARAKVHQPRLAAVYYGEGRVAIAERRFDAAVTALQQALALEPRASAIHYALATAYRGRGDQAQAAAHLARQGSLEPRPTDPLMAAIDNLLESAEAYNARGGFALDRGDWEEAARQFREGLRTAPNDAGLHHRLGTALAQAGDAAGAELAFRRALELSPQLARAHYSLGVLLASRGQFDDASARLGDAIRYEPGYAPAHAQLAQLLVRAKRFGEAERTLETARQLAPDDPDIAFAWAMLAIRRQDYVGARDRLASWMTIHPDQTQFRHALARLLAAAPDASVRDGKRAKVLVDELLKAGQSLELAETTAMMLAELGAFAEAAAVQRDVVTAARKGGSPAVIARVTANLARYERGEPCRTPFADNELP